MTRLAFSVMSVILNPGDGHHTSSYQRSDYCTQSPALTPASWSTALELGTQVQGEEPKAGKHPYSADKGCSECGLDKKDHATILL